jgi:hypothetical protein
LRSHNAVVAAKGPFREDVLPQGNGIMRDGASAAVSQ